MGNVFDNLWVEKFRPGDISDIVLSKDNRRIFQDIIAQGEIPNLLFIGRPGIGKTSLAKLLVKKELKCQYLYINASDENGIETIRSKVTNFSRTRSIDGSIKVIILDEVDGLTQDAQRALRNTMEEYSGFTRFILTANYGHRVIPAVQSRCQSFDLTPPLNLCQERINLILATQKVKIGKKQTGQLKELVRNNYPDLRRIINELQKFCLSGSLEITNTNIGKFADQILRLVRKGAVLKMRKTVIENEEKFNGDYPKLLKDMFDSIEQSNIEDIKKKECLLVIAEHLYRAAFVVDQEINFFSCLVQVSRSV
jgi:DNA polymerase III delta prime subunit